MAHRESAMRHTPHMRWPLPILARLVATALGAAIAVQLAADRLVAVPTAADPAAIRIDQVSSPSAAPLVLSWVAAVVVPLGLWALWRGLARPRPSTTRLQSVPHSTQPYQRDTSARLIVDRRGYLFARRVLFTGSRLPWTQLRSLPRDFDQRFIRPIALLTAGERTWWAVGNEFYWANASYGADTVGAVVDSLRWRRRARLDATQVDLVSATAERRARILADLRPNLSKHNGLVCIRCRQVIDLRAEATTPVWTDGGVRVADLQLLCSACQTSSHARPARVSATNT